jgi:rare lipoprotein A
MKKLITILSLAALNSCANTTDLKANLMPSDLQLSPKTIDENKNIVPDAPKIAENANASKFNGLDKKALTTNTKTSVQHRAGVSKLAGKQGVASWYGPQFHGKKTATGELFDMYGMTAAHNSLPIPSYAQITNLQNKRTIVVRINDRGPFFDNRVLDLSYFAAKQLGMEEAGTSPVAIKTIPAEQALMQLQKQKHPVYLQVGAFDNKETAKKLQRELGRHHLPVPQINASSHKGATLYKVQLPIKSSGNAVELNHKLSKLGIKDTQFVAQYQ